MEKAMVLPHLARIDLYEIPHGELELYRSSLTCRTPARFASSL